MHHHPLHTSYQEFTSFVKQPHCPFLNPMLIRLRFSFHLQHGYLFISFVSFFMYHFPLLFFFLITLQIRFSQCTITFQGFNYHLCSFISNLVIYLFHFYHFPFIIFHFDSSLSSLFSHSSVNVLLLFNTSLIIFAPSAPILLTTYFICIIYHLSFSSFILLCHHHSETV